MFFGKLCEILDFAAQDKGAGFACSRSFIQKNFKMMKKFAASAAFLFLLSLPVFAQTICEGFLPFEQGVFFEQTHYDAKGKVTSVSNAIVDEINPIDGGYSARITYDLVDGKGKELGAGQYDIHCEDGVFKMDLNSMMDPSMTESFQNMEMTLSGEGVQFPSELSEGQELPNGDTQIEIATNGMSIMKFTFTTSGRKVEARESVTTPAGTFECFRIRETMEYQAMFLKRSYTMVGWYSKKVGLVKQETYDHKDKLSSTMELTNWGRK